MTASRVFNFNPGPSALPLDVLKQTSIDVVNYQETGIGVAEMSHRSAEFTGIIQTAEALLRELLGIPKNYHVLFMQGGASSQFFMVPMNLLSPGQRAAYLNTGTWSKKAIKEANAFGEIDVPYSSEDQQFNRVPLQDEYAVSNDARYLYFVSNNTIYGTQFGAMPDKGVTLVSDMSSDIMSRTIDVSQFGIIFAGAQKNLGPAGVTVVIIRDDLLDEAPDTLPTMLRYKTHADKQSMFNTPPCLAIYMVGEVCKWLQKQGGVEKIEQVNRAKAASIYEVIDEGEYYRGHAEPGSRSVMNIAFNLPSAELEARFIKEAAAQGLVGLKGHRSIGGCRASMYNAFPPEGADKLAAFMREYRDTNAS